MTSFAIQTDEDEDLGFILFARHDGDWPPAGKNECIFNGFPYDAALLDDPRGRFVMEQKGQEWIADVSYSATEMLVRIDLSTGWVFELRSTESGNIWTAVRAGTTIRGTGQFL